jgi:hypothetical protein
MHPIFSTGLVIGLLCGAWMFVMGFTGWYVDPAKLNRFFLVILIEVAGLIWGLRKTAAQGRTYSGQVVAGTGMAIIAGVVIFCSSLLFTTVVFPNYLVDIQEMGRRLMQEQGKTAEEIQQALDASASTPLMNAISGFIGTFVTGVIVSAIAGLWIKAPARLQS